MSTDHISKKLENALNNLDILYSDLIEIADDIAKDVTAEIDSLIQYSRNNVENLSNEDIRNLILKLSLYAYQFSEIKEKSEFKSALSEILKKEAYAKIFNTAEGSVAAKDNTATLAIASEILVEEIYNLTAALFKIKLDEIHRIVSAFQSILVSRLSEAKLNAVTNIPE